MFSVLDYGAVPDGKTLCRTAFQKAIDACAEAGGGTVLVPVGKYLLGTVLMKSHVHVLFEPGALILGSIDYVHDYLPHEPFEGPAYQDESHTYFDHSLFVAKNCVDIGFSGHGTIDMQWAYDLEEDRRFSCRTCKIFAVRECDDLYFEDMTLLGATDLCLYLAGCNRVRIRGLSLHVSVDGISPDGCGNVVISDCVIKAQDDAIVLKSSYTLGRLIPCHDITISNCTLSSHATALKIGTETNGDFYNIVVTGCTIHDTFRSGIVLCSMDGSNVRGVMISNISMHNVSTPFCFRIGNRMRGPKGLPLGTLSDIFVSNLYAECTHLPFDCFEMHVPGVMEVGATAVPEDYPSSILGLASQPIRNVTLRDVTLRAFGGGTMEGTLPLPLPENERNYPENFIFGIGNKVPAACLVSRYVDGLRMENVRLETLNPDERPPHLMIDVKNFREN